MRRLPLTLSTPAQAAQLVGVDAVGARLQREADDLAARRLVGRLGRGRVGVRVGLRLRVIGLVGRLGSFKAELTEALRLGDEAAESAISQAGFKQSTWWEDNDQSLDVSFDWRR